MKRISIFKRLLSYLYPVRIQKSSGRYNSLLELFLYKGQYQLGTIDAIYSDGTRYVPLVLAFDTLGNKLQNIKHVVMLGTGIGSGIDILEARGVHPDYTLVDNEEVILTWVKNLNSKRTKQIKTVCEDAQVFINNASMHSCDLLIVDIFNGRKVPAFAMQNDFLQKCRQKIIPGGCFVMNYIVNSNTDWNLFISNAKSVFPNCKILESGVNRIIVTQV